MKNTIFLLFALVTFLSASSQVKISDMSTFNGNAENAYVPVVIGGINYKTLAKNFVAGKVDSVTYKTASPSNPDSLFSWSAGIRKQIGLISKTLIATVITDSTLVGDGSPGSPLSVSVPLPTLTTVADTTARNAIPPEDRYEGMIVYVTSEQKYYSLKGGVENVNWTELTTTESGGGTNVTIINIK